MKTSEMTGAALDWAVANCEKVPEYILNKPYRALELIELYSTDWSQGGPIIERELIKIDPRKGAWEATIWNECATLNPSYGPTPLIAAMRCYVASKLGDEIEIPKGLTP